MSGHSRYAYRTFESARRRSVQSFQMQNESDVRRTGIQLWIPSTLRNADLSKCKYPPNVIAFEAGTTQIFFEAARYFMNIIVITIPASVEVLRESCFSGCRSLSRVTFAAGSCLKRIEKGAFDHCERLKEIEIPCMVKVDHRIGTKVIRHCNVC